MSTMAMTRTALIVAATATLVAPVHGAPAGMQILVEDADRLQKDVTTLLSAEEEETLVSTDPAVKFSRASIRVDGGYVSQHTDGGELIFDLYKLGKNGKPMIFTKHSDLKYKAQNGHVEEESWQWLDVNVYAELFSDENRYQDIFEYVNHPGIQTNVRATKNQTTFSHNFRDWTDTSGDKNIVRHPYILLHRSLTTGRDLVLSGGASAQSKVTLQDPMINNDVINSALGSSTTVSLIGYMPIYVGKTKMELKMGFESHTNAQRVVWSVPKAKLQEFHADYSKPVESTRAKSKNQVTHERRQKTMEDQNRNTNADVYGYRDPSKDYDPTTYQNSQSGAIISIGTQKTKVKSDYNNILRSNRHLLTKKCIQNMEKLLRWLEKVDSTMTGNERTVLYNGASMEDGHAEAIITLNDDIITALKDKSLKGPAAKNPFGST